MPTKIKQLPPLEFLKECFSYDEHSGELSWQHRPPHHFKTERAYKRHLTVTAGKVISGKEADGYITVSIMIDGKEQRFKVHRICWALYHNRLPPLDKEVDHVDRIRINNRPYNLRLVSSQSNTHNRTANGAFYRKERDRWISQITVDGKKIYLGYFSTEEEAQAAYFKAKKTYHST